MERVKLTQKITLRPTSRSKPNSSPIRKFVNITSNSAGSRRLAPRCTRRLLSGSNSRHILYYKTTCTMYYVPDIERRIYF